MPLYLKMIAQQMPPKFPIAPTMPEIIPGCQISLCEYGREYGEVSIGR